MNPTNEELDLLFDDVVDYIAAKEYISIDEIKDFFDIGYNRATRLLEKMEEMEIVIWEFHNETSRYKVITSLVTEAQKRRRKKSTPKANIINTNNSNSEVLVTNFLGWIIGVVIFIIMIAVLHSCSGNSSAPETDYCSDDTTAYIYAKKFISTHLKAPSTAKFASYYDVKSSQPKECKFNFIGYVDAENSFGAMIRTQFEATVRYDKNKDTYYLEHLNM
ncbi:DNA translocase FtsK [Xenorhabdus kozodoii]|uniref:Cell division protein FtsK n=1 Tax=Xenorhabdus kozodoii TaxID=351676 RepID=A0A2D0L033_9GAMM|nr:DNA translocase FtsK [Xenorhabdus kozodoii]PHM69043.1 cell division protein FtsK [Xenorhabdus kozodoii]